MVNKLRAPGKSHRKSITGLAEGYSDVEFRGIGFIGSTHCSSEDKYLLMRPDREVLKTENIETNNQLTYFSFLNAFCKTFGRGTSTARLKQSVEAVSILVAGAELFYPRCRKGLEGAFRFCYYAAATGLPLR